ncbi:hypothetical protein PTSG_12142 [Salpingoeca rosetta]|uniref:Uncharacterized protein n=1 Tax=Salpingoeca rosetta (strain ATCC 50818 / BSB-021) TaxID=946362 RepID=F2U712_SALR5|nr:uncharacterized protein PTSG_12142 [Salpingoeca rosetta]EGD83644.1 hypothetical protein PTSG_12142 [Salpingoeca rosetta]|eukprot:XP_004995148.1 hypothetical protein PTSG_12142 [Salpingoeca rosetta]
MTAVATLSATAVLATTAAMLMCCAWVQPAAAARFVWRGCDTNWNHNPDNWQNGVSPSTSSDPITTVFFGPSTVEEEATWKPVSSFVSAGSLAMHELVLPSDGILELDPDGTELVFLEREDTVVPEAKFIGGQGFREECDFNCHKNWETIDGSDVDSPPCADDIAQFDGSSSYKLFVRGFTPLDTLIMGGARFDSDDQRTLLPEYQFSPNPRDLEVFFKSGDPVALTQRCQDVGQYDASRDECVCYSTCPDASLGRDNNAQIRSAGKALAAENLAELTATTTVLFQYKFSYKLLLNTLPPDIVVDAFDEAFTLPASVTGMENAIADLITESFGGAVQVQGTLTRTSTRFTYMGSVTGPAIALSGLTASHLDKTFDTTWPSSDRLFALHAWTTVMTEALRGLELSCSIDLADVETTCASQFGSACSDVAYLLHTAQPGSELANALSVMSQISDYLVSINHVVTTTTTVSTTTTTTTTAATTTTTTTTTTSTTDASTTSSANVNATTASATTTTTSTAGAQSTTTTTTTPADTTTTAATTPPPFVLDMSGLALMSNVDVDEFRATVTAFALGSFASVPQPYRNSVVGTYLLQAVRCLDIDAASSDAQALSTVEEQEHTISFVVGTLLPQSDVFAMFQSWNYDRFTSMLCQRLKGLPPLEGIDCDNVQISLYTYGDQQQAQSNAAARRRRFNAIDLLRITITYTMLVDVSLCAPGRVHPSCPLVETQDANSRYTELLDFITSLTSDFEVKTASSCVSLEDGILPNCLVSTIYQDLFDQLWPDGTRPRASTPSRGSWPTLIEQQFYSLIGNCGVRCASDGTSFLTTQDEADAAATLNSVSNQVIAMIDAFIASSTTTTTTTTNAGDTTTTTNGGGNRGSGAASTASVPVGAVGGAAGGAVVLIAVIVLVVIMRRRASSSGGGSAGNKKRGALNERQVVSFENPMYDDPMPVQQAIYSDAGVGDAEEEGLYDEPAFAMGQDKKQNPLYQSSEDLLADEYDDVAGEGDEMGGYLDVAPDDAPGDNDDDGDDGDDLGANGGYDNAANLGVKAENGYGFEEGGDGSGDGDGNAQATPPQQPVYDTPDADVPQPIYGTIEDEDE